MIGNLYSRKLSRNCGLYALASLRGTAAVSGRHRRGADLATGKSAPLPPITAPFTIHHIAKGSGQGYSQATADFNHDGKPDIAALGLNADAIYWYENPYWTSHLIITAKDVPKPVFMDAADIDGDGIPEILLAFHFNTDPHKDGGTVATLH